MAKKAAHLDCFDKTNNQDTLRICVFRCAFRGVPLTFACKDELCGIAVDCGPLYIGHPDIVRCWVLGSELSPRNLPNLPNLPNLSNLLNISNLRIG